MWRFHEGLGINLPSCPFERGRTQWKVEGSRRQRGRKSGFFERSQNFRYGAWLPQVGPTLPRCAVGDWVIFFSHFLRGPCLSFPPHLMCPRPPSRVPWTCRTSVHHGTGCLSCPLLERTSPQIFYWLALSCQVSAEIAPPPKRWPPQSLLVTSPRLIVFSAVTMIGNDLAHSFVWYLSLCPRNVISEGTGTLALIYCHRPSARTWPSNTEGIYDHNY